MLYTPPLPLPFMGGELLAHFFTHDRGAVRIHSNVIFV